MVSFTFKVSNRDNKQSNLFNLFSQSVVDKNVTRIENFVKPEEEGRLDLVCKRLYGTIDHIEELMVINNIMNPFNIKAGDEILYVDPGKINLFREKEKEEIEDEDNKKQNKNTRKDPKRQKGVVPTIRPIDFEQIMVDKKSKKIRLNTKLG